MDKGINAEVVREFKLLIPKEESPEIDHVIPVALGGEIVGFNNLQIICKSCHSKKTIEDLKSIRLGK